MVDEDGDGDGDEEDEEEECYHLLDAFNADALQVVSEDLVMRGHGGALECGVALEEPINTRVVGDVSVDDQARVEVGCLLVNVTGGPVGRVESSVMAFDGAHVQNSGLFESWCFVQTVDCMVNLRDLPFSYKIELPFYRNTGG